MESKLNIEEFGDESPMPFGKYQGTKMKDVPAYYLIYMYDMAYFYGKVKDYVKANYEVLQKEANKSKQK